MPTKPKQVTPPAITQKLIEESWQVFVSTLKHEGHNIRWAEKIPRHKIKRIFLKIAQLRKLWMGLNDIERSYLPTELLASSELPSAESLLPPDSSEYHRANKIALKLDAALAWHNEYEFLCKEANHDRRRKDAEKALTAHLLDYWREKTGQIPKGRKDARDLNLPLNIWIAEIQEKMRAYGKNTKTAEDIKNKALLRLRGYRPDDMIVEVAKLL
ncbi:MAG: hypothetical protein SFW65_05640 [Alphaproteobacteria bacterium]|nr:hypothetical protein [Alphaproteobacteria bacterium]